VFGLVESLWKAGSDKELLDVGDGRIVGHRWVGRAGMSRVLLRGTRDGRGGESELLFCEG
jgi:hypothetical protein